MPAYHNLRVDENDANTAINFFTDAASYWAALVETEIEEGVDKEQISLFTGAQLKFCISLYEQMKVKFSRNEDSNSIIESRKILAKMEGMS